METAAIVIIFTLFMLIKHEDLRNRAIRLARARPVKRHDPGTGRCRPPAEPLFALAMSGQYRLRRRVWISALLDRRAPRAALGSLRGSPAVCPLCRDAGRAALPVALALAVFPGWHHAALAFGVFLVLELSVANFVEPLLYGAHTGISSLAILVAAVFWATIWGPVGLILSTPLTGLPDRARPSRSPIELS